MFQGRKIITLLISVLAAVVLWLYVVTNVTPERDFRVSSVHVSIDGMSALEERGLVITKQSDDEIDLDIRTSRDNLSKLNKSSIRINADVSKIREPGSYTLNTVVTFPDTVRTSAVVILQKSEITITVEQLQKQSFNIQLKTTGDVMDGFLFDKANAVLDPMQVVVTGLEEDIAKIADVVVNYDVSNLIETAYPTVSLLFLDEEGNEIEFSEHTSFSVTDTRLTLPVYRTREIQLALDYLEGGGVKASNVKLTFDPASSIRVMGTADVIDALDDSLVLGTVDLAKIPDEYEQTFSLDVLPAGVNNISGIKDVTAIIKLTGVSTDTIDVSDIRLKNLKPDYEVKLATLTASVTVKGSTEEIEELKKAKDSGIYIEVDLEDYQSQTGAFTVSGRVVNVNHPELLVKSTVDIGVVITYIPEHPDQTPE